MYVMPNSTASDAAPESAQYDFPHSLLDLSNLDFKRANLSEADLFGSKLDSADLSGANLSGAKLDRAWIMRANFTNADLSNASLFGLVVSSGLEIRLDEAPIFKGANFSGARIITRLSRFDL